MKNARRLRLVAIAAVPIVLGLGYLGVTLNARRAINQRIADHLTEATTSLKEAREHNEKVEALRAEAFAHFERQERKEGEDTWSRSLVLAAATERLYARAGQALESGLELDGTRRDIRDELGDILYERALLAERDHRRAQLDELLQRLEVYDKSGERTDRFTTPASVTVTTTPVPAHITIEKYVDRSGRLVPEKVREIDATPSATLELDPGSYLLTCSAPQRYEVRYPVLLRRGERLEIPIHLPEASKIPKGFVYIPGGRFNFGTSAAEEIRTFLDTTPIHESQTDPYLIAQTETTYAEWLEYLNALPDKQRAAHDAKFASSYRGSVELSELSGGKWTLTIRPAGQVYTAVSGEMIQYHARSQRAKQDWLRFPAVGIAVVDVEDYARWLDASGRVPGARMCREDEWEKAARGADDREFPHGYKIEPDDANFDLTYGREPGGFGPDHVGSHPISRSPFGVDDMAGNVWEWTRSRLSANVFVVRGGSFHQFNTVNRSTNRESSEPAARDVTLGMRICASAPPR